MIFFTILLILLSHHITQSQSVRIHPLQYISNLKELSNIIDETDLDTIPDNTDISIHRAYKNGGTLSNNLEEDSIRNFDDKSKSTLVVIDTEKEEDEEDELAQKKSEIETMRNEKFSDGFTIVIDNNGDNQNVIKKDEIYNEMEDSYDEIQKRFGDVIKEPLRRKHVRVIVITPNEQSQYNDGGDSDNDNILTKVNVNNGKQEDDLIKQTDNLESEVDSIKSARKKTELEIDIAKLQKVKDKMTNLKKSTDDFKIADKDLDMDILNPAIEKYMNGFNGYLKKYLNAEEEEKGSKNNLISFKSVSDSGQTDLSEKVKDSDKTHSVALLSKHKDIGDEHEVKAFSNLTKKNLTDNTDTGKEDVTLNTPVGNIKKPILPPGNPHPDDAHIMKAKASVSENADKKSSKRKTKSSKQKEDDLNKGKSILSADENSNYEVNKRKEKITKNKQNTRSSEKIKTAEEKENKGDTFIQTYEGDMSIGKSPNKVEASPNKVEASPNKVEASPNKVEASPNKVEASPNKVEASPNKVERLPIKIEVLSNKVEVMPNKVDIKPTQDENTQSPQESTKQNFENNNDSNQIKYEPSSGLKLIDNSKAEAIIEFLNKDPLESWRFPFNTLKSLDLNATTLRSGLVFSGNIDRLKGVMRRALEGKDIILSIVGGSISAGGGLYKDKKSIEGLYYKGVVDWWNKMIMPLTGSEMKLNNIAIGSIGTDYFSYCVKNHISIDTDIVLWELSANDYNRYKMLPTKGARPLERFTRMVLDLPNKPALMYLNFFKGIDYKNSRDSCPDFEDQGEDVIAHYYKIPSLSWRAMVCKGLILQQPGFLMENLFSLDQYHPSLKGHAQAALLILLHLRHVMRAVLQWAIEHDGTIKRFEDLYSIPEPLFMGPKYPEPLCWSVISPNISDKITNSLQTRVIQNNGFLMEYATNFPIRYDKVACWKAEKQNAMLSILFTIPQDMNSERQIISRYELAITTHTRWGGSAFVWIDDNKNKPVIIKEGRLGDPGKRTQVDSISSDLSVGTHTLNILTSEAGFCLSAIMIAS